MPRSHLGGHLLPRILSRHNIWIAVAAAPAFTGGRQSGPSTFDEAEKYADIGVFLRSVEKRRKLGDEYVCPNI